MFIFKKEDDLYTTFLDVIVTCIATHVLGRREAWREFWCADLKEKDNFEEIWIYGKIILKYVLMKYDRRT
jgi:hypothetical protein